MYGLIGRINPNQREHTGFLNMTQFGFDIIFDKLNFKNFLYEEIEEVVQARVLEHVSNAENLELWEGTMRWLAH